MKEQTLYILCGEAFSGKSTLAKTLADKYGAKIVGIDVVYFAAADILALESTPEEDDSSLWKNLWPVVLQGIKNQLLLCKSVAVDDNCFRLSRRDELRALANKMNIRAILIYADTPAEILRERKEKNKISKTRHDVPSAWMAEDAVKFERPSADENPIIFKPGDSIETLFHNIESQF